MALAVIIFVITVTMWSDKPLLDWSLTLLASGSGAYWWGGLAGHYGDRLFK